MIQIGDLTIWVPADENIATRLRYPKNPEDFQQLITMLTSTPEILPIDRRQRNQHLLELLKDGRAESLCRALRDMSAIRKQRTWGDYDRDLMKRIQKAFISEWSFVLSVNPHDAEVELQKMLAENAQ
jgi:RNA polymerase-interacting CarD/CdnL/TRCF family regulator